MENNITLPDLLVYASILGLVIARDSHGRRRKAMGFATIFLASIMAGWFGTVFLELLPGGWTGQAWYALEMAGLALFVAALVPITGILKIRYGADGEVTGITVG